MTETKKKLPEPIPVNSKKLIDGLGTIFGGVIQLLAAMEPGMAKKLTDMAINGVPKEKAQPASTVTADDITKIIVQKIKQNRSNSEKIGSILKTYGAAKVSELSADKYEAFLTDVSQL